MTAQRHRRGIDASFSSRQWAGFGLSGQSVTYAPWRVTPGGTDVLIEMWDKRHGDDFEMRRAGWRHGGLGPKQLRASGFPVDARLPANLLERFTALADSCTPKEVCQFIMEHGPLGVRFRDGEILSAEDSIDPAVGMGREVVEDWQRLSTATRNALEINSRLSSKRRVPAQLLLPLGALIGGNWPKLANRIKAESTLELFVYRWLEAARIRLSLAYGPGHPQLLLFGDRRSQVFPVLGMQLAQRLAGARQTLVCTRCQQPFLRFRAARISGPAVCRECRRRETNRRNQAARRAREKATS